MVTGATRLGFEYSIDDQAFESMEFFDALVEIEDGSVMSGLSRLSSAILTKEQKKTLYKLIKAERGFADPEELYNNLDDIIKSAGDSAKK